MDELIAWGIAGILMLLIAAILGVYGVISLIVTAAQAFASGQNDFVLMIVAAVLLLFFAYTGFGLWLRRTNRI
jgi:apolipoprotein N-acyltransferase